MVTCASVCACVHTCVCVCVSWLKGSGASEKTREQRARAARTRAARGCSALGQMKSKLDVEYLRLYYS